MLEMIDDKIGVIPLFDPDKSKGGIWIPDQAKERCDQGIVKYIGPKCEHVQIGDYVLFSGYTGKALQFEEEGVIIIFSEEFVVAKFEGGEIPDTEIPGLFFEGEDRTFFPATLEFALTLIAKAVQEADWRREMKSKEMKEHRPKEAAIGQ